MVGRERELEQLLEAWRHARAGRGRAVQIVGEAGVGKSRLVDELRRHIASEWPAWAYTCGASHRRHSALHAAIDLLAQTLDLAPGSSREQLRSRLRERLLGTPQEAAIPRLEALLDLPASLADATTARDVPRDRTLDDLAQWIASFAGERPALIVAEDVHFMDPSSADVLARVAREVRGSPALLIVTLRDIDEHAPSHAEWNTTLRLQPLTRGETRRLIEDRIAAQPDSPKPPEALLEVVVDRADGLPFFAEELARTLVESAQPGRALETATQPRARLTSAIPATLQDSLMARLDRLGPLKSIAQTASVLGRDFSADVLAAVLTSPAVRVPLLHSEVYTALEQLVAAQILEPQRDARRGRYAFRHALIRETAYHSLLRRTRRDLHRAAATVLRNELPGLRERAPELLAHHYDSGEQLGQAITYWLRAGQSAIARSATAEAKTHLRRALELIRVHPVHPAPAHPESAERESAEPESAMAWTRADRDRRELVAQSALAVALYTREGYASSELGRAVSRARELCSRVGWTALTPLVAQLQATCWLSRGEYLRASRVATQLIREARTHHDDATCRRAHGQLGQALLFRGRFERACTELSLGIEPREVEDARRVARTQGVDSSSMCIGWRSWSHHFTGAFAESRCDAQKALAWAEQIDHPYTLALTWLVAGTLHQLREEPDPARRYAEKARDLSVDYRFAFLEAWARALAGWISIDAGQVESGLVQLETGLAAWDRLEVGVARSLWLAQSGRAQLALGRIDAGLDLVERAAAHTERSGERIYASELLLLQAEARPLGPAAPEALLRRGCSRALRTGNRWSALRASLALVRLQASGGSDAPERRRLARIRDSVDSSEPLPLLMAVDEALACPTPR